MTNNKQQTEINAVEYLDKVNQFAKENNTGKPKQQTAVDWLVEHFQKLQREGEKMSWKQIIDITELAKEMEKERMIGFTNKYINEELWVNCNAIESDSTVEQYYEKTYGGNK
jgi:hypothetical protein